MRYGQSGCLGDQNGRGKTAATFRLLRASIEFSTVSSLFTWTMATREVMMATRLQSISTIPLTVLSLLPPHLDSITTLVSLLTLSHSTRSIILETLTPATLFHLCYISPTIFPPWYLLSIISPSLSTRLSTTTTFRNSFKFACRHGPTSLLSNIHTQHSIPTFLPFNFLSLQHAHILHQLINPLTDLVDKCIGAQWLNCEDFWNGGREDAVTLYGEADQSVWQCIVYGELFGKRYEEGLEWLLERQCIDSSTQDSHHTNAGDETLNHDEKNEIKDANGVAKKDNDKDDPGVMDQRTWARRNGCDVSLRLEYIKYCIPDWHILSSVKHPLSNQRAVTSSYLPSPSPSPPSPSSPHPSSSSNTPPVPPIHSLRNLSLDSVYSNPATLGQTEHASALLHLLCQSPLWAQITSAIRLCAGPDFGISTYESFNGLEGPGWKQLLWENALWTMGWDAVELIVEEWGKREENDKARMWRLLRSQQPSSSSPSRPNAYTNLGSTGNSNGLPDASTGRDAEPQRSPLERLKHLRRLIDTLTVPPEEVNLEYQTPRYTRRDETFMLPYLVGDLRLAIFLVH